jgi:large subunit ribosomal protein L7/L12
MGITRDDVKEYIKNMPVSELTELREELEEELGISAPAPAMMPMMPAEYPTEVVEEEQTEFDVVMTSIGDKKIPVIKKVRELTNLGLKQCKDLVDALPGNIKEGISKEEADSVVKLLEEVGATVEIK